MNRQSKIRVCVISIFVAIGVVPWLTLYPRLGEDVRFGTTVVPLDTQVPVFGEPVPTVIELGDVVIQSDTPKMRRLLKTREYLQQHSVCRWHEHNPETGIKVCETGSEVSYPTL